MGGMWKRETQLVLCLEALGVQARACLTQSALVNLAIWAALAFWAYSRSAYWPLALQPLATLIIDAFERVAGVSPFSREDGSIALYNHMRFITANPFGGGIDLGFNFYNGDYSKSADKAQTDKFEHAWKLLGLQEGMRVLDCGCGMGDWLYWLKTVKNCTVVGINMTDAHVLVVRKRGMKCIHSDWQTLFADKARFAELAGQFDCVTFWDTIEHYCKASEITVLGGLGRPGGTEVGTEKGTRNEQKRIDTYGNLFKMAGELLDPNSSCGKMWSSTLHQTHSWKEEGLYGFWQIYAMISYYDGVYPYLRDGLSKFAPYGGFKLTHEEDRTEDYRMTSLLERNHFGYVKYSGEPCALVSSLCCLFTDPHFWVFHIDAVLGLLGLETCWMWHLGGIEPHKPKKDAIAMLLWQVYSKAKA
uniref:Methyltransferase domain-containing protein n=1 Tax=Calcidiscus leptoporus TaxID=127549 RepID=A0A7S0IY72_9EUKA|mmetsp:Transcript_29360/g.68647  ORF Transcript_29360/g.68647 Transcript_29360/m.68647 type:complete len:416 (+) Transcript_29360:45-1292(+)